jgi:hypothetical protein
VTDRFRQIIDEFRFGFAAAEAVFCGTDPLRPAVRVGGYTPGVDIDDLPDGLPPGSLVAPDPTSPWMTTERTG